MSLTKQEVDAVIDKLGEGDYTCYFFLPDFERPSGGVKVTYDHVRCMNQNGFNAKIIHQKSGFIPEWLEEYYEKNEDGTYDDLPMVYLDDGKLAINMEDFFFIPEGYPQLMENLQKQGAPCKKIVFCQNWYYVLNALPAGVFWDQYGIRDCMSVSESQTQYLKMIMPFLRTKNVYGHIPSDVFFPPEKLSGKKLEVAFIPSRDGGTKSYNVIKTFFALFPYFKFIKFREVKGLSKEEYAQTLRECAFYVHFDEYSSWGTAPIEAYLSKCLVAGWDGVGGREYMNTKNTWLVPNGDIMRLALAIGNMVETYIMHDITEERYQEMENATLNYSLDSEKDSIIRAHNEYRDERVSELKQMAELAEKLEKESEEK